MEPEAAAKRAINWQLVRRMFWILLGVWAIAAGCTLNQARGDLTEGREALTVLAGTEPLDTDLVVLQAELGAAHAPVESGASKLRSPVLWPLRPLPVVGRQLAAARSIAGAADDVLVHTQSTVTAAIGVQDALPSQRVERLVTLGEQLSELDTVIAERDLGPNHDLVDMVASARIDADQLLADIGVEVHTASVIVDGLAGFLGNSHYLMLGANVNEMQAGGGTPLNFGEVRLKDGDFKVSGVESILEATLDGPVELVDNDIGELWGFLTPTNDFKKLMLTHRFSEYSGPQALVMYDDAKGANLDGVLLVDSLALQGLLAIVGPVVVDEQEFTADNVLDYIFVEQYGEFLTGDEVSLDNLSTLSEGQEARYDRQAGLAAATFAKVAEGAWGPVEMIQGLRPIAEGRHLLAYSADPDQQAMWEAMGVAGVLDGDEVGVSLLNLGANKLDPYMGIDVDAVTSVQPDGTTELSLTATITNNTPPGLPDAVNGYYWETLGLASPQTYHGRIMLLLPGNAVAVELDQVTEDGLEVFGIDGRNVVVVTKATIADGNTRVVSAAVTLPAEVTELTMMPSARYPVVRYLWNGVALNDFAPHTLVLGE